jgi:Lon protease-like protein
MPDRVVPDFPLFPLGIVALPHELVPLRIFEERYRAMIGDCLERGSEFGIVWADDDGVRAVGCAMEITEILEQMDDGRMNILVEGTTPFRLIERDERQPYPAGMVELLEDRQEPVDGGVTSEARDGFAALVERVTAERPDTGMLAHLGAYEMAASVDIGMDAKQGLLELRSERARLRLLARLFKAAMERLDTADRIAEQAQGNGKVKF